MRRAVTLSFARVAVAVASCLAAAVLTDAARAGSTPPAATPAKSAPAMPAVQDIKTRLDLRDSFNLNRGKVRLVAFFSPSCSHCQNNARSIQNYILDKTKDADIAVTIVWMPVSEADTRQAIAAAASVIPDPRVRHYWDPKVTLNAQLRDAIQFDFNVRLYDIVLLYDRQATWNDRVPRPGFWMHEFRGAPGPFWDPAVLAVQVSKALSGQPLDTPQPQ
jgi:hypothetical protein